MTKFRRGWSWKLCSACLALAGAIALPMDCAFTQTAPNIATKAEILIEGYETQVPPTYHILYLSHLTCHSTAAGGTNPDQISIQIHNQHVWGPAIMTAGNVAKLNTVGGIPFHKKVRVEIFDQSKRIGSAHISNTGSGLLQFIYGHANYTLTYQVIAGAAI